MYARNLLSSKCLAHSAHFVISVTLCESPASIPILQMRKLRFQQSNSSSREVRRLAQHHRVEGVEPGFILRWSGSRVHALITALSLDCQCLRYPILLTIRQKLVSKKWGASTCQ